MLLACFLNGGGTDLAGVGLTLCTGCRGASADRLGTTPSLSLLPSV